MPNILCCLLLLALASFAAPTRAADDASGEQPGHGPLAADERFPSHVFQWQPRRRQRVELSFHYGLSQPLFLHGFNAALDARIGRLVLSYSHGQGLEYDRTPGALTAAEKQAGLHLALPVTTGFGAGMVLIDELYVLGDVKFHHFDARLGAEQHGYDTLTLGVELGWRFFIWKGLHVAPVVRYWPNVWSSAPRGGVRFHEADGGLLEHQPAWQGFSNSGLFVNLLVGWAFQL